MQKERYERRRLACGSKRSTEYAVGSDGVPMEQADRPAPYIELMPTTPPLIPRCLNSWKTARLTVGKSVMSHLELMVKGGNNKALEMKNMREGAQMIRLISPLRGDPCSYEIIGKLGNGNTGVVYDAWSNTSKKRYAIKVVRMSADHRFFNRRLRAFLDESTIHAYMSQHDPHNDCCLLRIEDFCVEKQWEPYYGAVMPLGGRTLSHYMSLSAPNGLFHRDINQIVKRLTVALIQWYKIGVSHGDLKAGNLMFTEEFDAQQHGSQLENDNRTEHWQDAEHAKVREDFLNWTRPGQTESRIFKNRGNDCRIILPEGVIDSLQFIDLGASQLFRLKDIRDQRPPCTLYLKAPEDVWALGDGSKRDVWALGLLLMEMYCGRKWIVNMQNIPYAEAWQQLGLTIPSWLNTEVPINQRHSESHEKWQKGIKSLKPHEVISLDKTFASDRRGCRLKELVKACLTIDPICRPTPEELMQYSYISKIVFRSLSKK